MMPEVEPGLNKAKIKVDVTLLVCVDFASLFCGLGKENIGQRGDLFEGKCSINLSGLGLPVSSMYLMKLTSFSLIHGHLYWTV